MSWPVVLTPSAQRDLRRLDPPIAKRVLEALARFADTSPGTSGASVARISRNGDSGLAIGACAFGVMTCNTSSLSSTYAHGGRPIANMERP